MIYSTHLLSGIFDYPLDEDHHELGALFMVH